MKKVFYLIITLLMAIPTLSRALDASTSSPTSISSSANDWESVGNVILFCDNGHGYVQRVESAHLYMYKTQEGILYKVVRLTATGEESNEVLFVSKLTSPWFPQGSVTGQSNPPSYNATAGDFYLNI